jgi:hypothetical protein
MSDPDFFSLVTVQIETRLHNQNSQQPLALLPIDSAATVGFTMLRIVRLVHPAASLMWLWTLSVMWSK